MANLGSLVALIADIEAKVTTNGANENTGSRVRQSLKNIADTLNGLIPSAPYGSVLPGIPMTYSTTRNSAGITNGDFRTNNAGMGLVTQLFINQQDLASNDQGVLLAAFSAGGFIYTVDAYQQVMVWKVTACVDSGIFYTLTATYVSGAEHIAGPIWATYAPAEVTGKKVWRANVIQDTAPLTATVIENSLGGTIVWSLPVANTHRGTLTGAFAGNVQVFLSTSSPPDFPSLGWLKLSDDQIDLYFEEGVVLPISVLIIVG